MAAPADQGPPDEALVRRVQDGDHEAFAALVRRHEGRVYNLAYRMLGRAEDARDAAQEAFLSCYRHIGRFRGDASFATWIHRIAVNACYDQLRRRTPVPTDPDELPQPPSADPGDRAAAAADVQRALLSVPEEFRAALVLHDLLDVSVDDVAAALEIPAGTVKSRLHRGRVHLARALGAGATEPEPTTGREPRGVPSPSKRPNP